MNSVLSKRGRRKSVHEDHIYLFSKRTADDVHSIWVCEKWSTCKGRVWTNEKSGEVVKVVNLHSHAAQAASPEAIRLVNEAVTKARTTQETPQQILTDVVSGAHSNVAALLPKKASLKRTIRLARQLGNIPRLPQTLDQLVIPLEFQEISIDGVQQQFLLHDSAVKQLYTIHVVHSGLVVPLVYTLLTDKSRSTYQRLLQELEKLQPGLQPDNLMLDFELAAIQAFESEFPNLVKTGCFFHLSQSVWRKVQNEGLKMQYQGDHEFAHWIRMIPALAFLPPQNVVQSFEELVEDPDFPQEAIAIANYFEDSYIGQMNRRGRQAPLFPVQFWNVYERTLNDQQRTNNDVEGWHRSFRETCGTLFQNIYHFINCLKHQQELHSFEIIQIIAGNPIAARNKKYAVISARVKRIVQDFNNRSLMDYLRGIAYSFEF
ncbi:unnamed protein product [Ranitomeya imitator]|uniref:MULE transposase domain-containing protein n=1 Tax=Ranitomeya imitator TaxID=111125 RepID=A0ABN9M928_9NEOB|nr:unnamed protein product [Ranitomeya imitator]